MTETEKLVAFIERNTRRGRNGAYIADVSAFAEALTAWNTRPSVVPDREGVARIVFEAMYWASRNPHADAVQVAIREGVAADAILSLLGGGGVPAGWQPIETAPKDGSPFLGFERQGVHPGDYAVCRWSLTRGFVGDQIGEPTHWIPLPDAPASTVEG